MVNSSNSYIHQERIIATINQLQRYTRKCISDRLDCDYASAVDEAQKMLQKMERAVTLLQATYDILEEQAGQYYVNNIFEQTVFYDGVECDGNCLMEDIGHYLEDLEKSVT